MSLLRPIADAWVGRTRQPDSAAVAASANKIPAIVVTGASRGIGLALARLLRDKTDHALVLIARSATELAAAAETLRHGRDTLIVELPLDVTDNDAAARIRDALEAQGLYLDYLIQSAGVGYAGAFVAQQPANLDQLIALNITAVSRLTRAFLPELLARGRGGILNVASLGGLMPGPGQSAYYASKAYVISLTEGLAFEARGRGVRVAALAPGPVETGFHEHMGGEGALYRWILPQRSPEMVARVGWRGFELGHTVITPGFFETFLGFSVRFLPRTLVTAVLGVLLSTPANRK